MVLPRERAYIESLAVYVNTTDPKLASPAARLLSYAEALREKVYSIYKEEDENSAIMYGLALLAVGYYNEQEPEDGFPNLLAAGAIEQQVVAWNPGSPGGLHYSIHSYDQPALAARALPAAHAYLNSSTAVPHAIHMPSHIYCDLGLWRDAMDANIVSMDTAFARDNSYTGDW